MVSSSSLSLSLIAYILILCICTFNGVKAEDYTLQSNCFGYDWNGMGCTSNGQIVTVPIGNHTVVVSGNLTALYPVIFTTNTTTKELWSGAFPNEARGTQSGTISLTVMESDVGTQVYYQCAGANNSFYGTIVFVESPDVNITDLSSSTGAGNEMNISSSTGMAGNFSDMSSSTGSFPTVSSSSGSSSGGGMVYLTADCAGYSWDGANCSAEPADVTIPVGITYVVLGGSFIASHPVVFTTDIDSVVPWRGADPNPANGTTNGTIALTVTPFDQGRVVYYRSVTDGFFGRIWLVSSTPLVVSSSSGSGITENATSSTGGIMNNNGSSSSSSTGTIIIGPDTGIDDDGNNNETSTDSSSSSSSGMSGDASSGMAQFPELSSSGHDGVRDNSALVLSPSVVPALATVLILATGRLLLK